jgi:hypothetical protein
MNRIGIFDVWYLIYDLNVPRTHFEFTSTSSVQALSVTATQKNHQEKQQSKIKGIQKWVPFLIELTCKMAYTIMRLFILLI